MDDRMMELEREEKIFENRIVTIDNQKGRIGLSHLQKALMSLLKRERKLKW